MRCIISFSTLTRKNRKQNNTKHKAEHKKQNNKGGKKNQTICSVTKIEKSYNLGEFIIESVIAFSNKRIKHV